MRKSKLESYEDILKALVSRNLTTDQMLYQINVDSTILGQRLGFLIKNSLVEEQELGKTTLYTITERGMAVLKALNFQKHLNKIANRIKAVNEELRVLKST
ncbi:MAG: winged helix-turn-helix domain-containing protein [Candidatus Bathyarchaeota archaeon]|jgi:predicted transcriptional regulator